ncbi:MAG: ABC transporter ATP-binding protein [Comamonas sp.]
MSFLELKNITKSYGDNCVVSNVNLSVEKGEFISLLGPSGCGKTTTLQMIAGITDVTSGAVVLDGRDITHAKPNTRGLGVVFQTYALFPHMTVVQNVSFGLEMRKVPAAERAGRIKEALALVHLDQYADRYPRELSGGQRQRVALARALVIQPPVLLLDEPLSNLDAKLREEMQFELRQIQRKVGTTTIMVTHDQSEAMSVSDRVVVMEAGRVTQIDRPVDVYEHPQNLFISTFVGKANLLQGRAKEVNGVAATFGVGPVDVRCLPKAGHGAVAGAQATLALRPEKIGLRPAGQGRFDARVKERFFLGNQWMYRLDSPVGELLVVTMNDGAEPVGVGQEVGIDWNDTSVRLVGAH